MKKFIIGIAVAATALIGFLPAANASKPSEDGIELPRGTHLKVDICHWANGHPHIVPASADAVTTEQDVKHGSMKLNGNLSLVSFTPHATPGHAQDFIAAVYTKRGNDITFTYVDPQDRSCKGDDEIPNPVTVQLCFEGDVSTFGPALEVDVAADVALFLEANPGAVVFNEGDTCELPEEETTTTTLLEEPVVPVVPVEPVVVPVVEPAAPVAAPRTAAPVVLPHTV